MALDRLDESALNRYIPFERIFLYRLDELLRMVMYHVGENNRLSDRIILLI